MHLQKIFDVGHRPKLFPRQHQSPPELAPTLAKRATEGLRGKVGRDGTGKHIRGRGEGGGGERTHFLLALTYLTIEHASLSQRSTVPSP